jgi:phospholipase/lecithinase/hemolysin
MSNSHYLRVCGFLFHISYVELTFVNVPDIGATPESQQSSDEELSERATELTKQFNKELSERMRRIERDLNLDLVDFNLFQFFRFVIKNSAALGFTNSDKRNYGKLSIISPLL